MILNNFKKYSPLTDSDNTLLKTCGEILKKERGICFFAHQDDETLGAFSFLNSFKNHIKKIIYITNGAENNDLNTAKTRKNEAINALKTMDFDLEKIEFWDLYSLDYPVTYHKCVDKTIDIIKIHNPDFILTHDYDGGHPDHDWAFASVSLACNYLKRRDIPLYSFAEYNIRKKLNSDSNMYNTNIDSVTSHNKILLKNYQKKEKIISHNIFREMYTKKIETLKNFKTQMTDVSYFEPWINEGYYHYDEIPLPQMLCSPPSDTILFYEFVKVLQFGEFKKELTKNILRLKL